MSRFRAILMYHSLDDSGSVLSIEPSVFRSQMRSLFERGIPSVTPQQLLAGQGFEAGQPALSLTFDDGFANFYTQAFPALSDFRLKATVFLVAGYGGGVSDWPGQPGEFRSRDLLTWSKIAELQKAGVQIGAHSMTHPSLTRLPFDKAREEVLGSKRALEDRIGEPVTTFAYPYGAENEPLRRLVAENFEIGCSTRLGYLSAEPKPESLERVDVCYLRDLFWFRRLFRRSTGAYLVARAALRRGKQTLLGPA
ncbi:MAG: polysaccharide deacetylase family protein [Acidobacteria bacterium]|nr:polysaccharide deacetylase family protein [Acidobacteriota bacterium]